MPDPRTPNQRPLIIAAAVVFTMIFALGATQGWARPRVTSDSPSLDRGHALVQQNCAGCHAIEPTGRSPNPRSPPFRTLHTRYPIEDLAESMSEGLLNAHTGMPAFQFSNGEADDIMAYLTELQTRPRPRHHRLG
jgi:cytochrome c